MTERAPWTIGTVSKWATDDFRGRGIDNPRLDAEVLLAWSLGITRTKLIVDFERELTPDELGRFRDLVKRRRAHEPVAYLRGEREFFGRPFRVDSRVLIPRPDTETLVEAALARTRHVSMATRALDLCTGSGCVAITIARERPTACVFATDASDGALEVARGNAQRLGAYNVAFLHGDLYCGIERRFDVITANPPYIPTAEIAALVPDIREHEPRLALDGGVDGLSIVRRLVAEAPGHLVRGGALAVEVAAEQAEAVAALFSHAGFVDVRRALDYAKIERVVHGTLG
jgi:release factor glutamine methyltransferase